MDEQQNSGDDEIMRMFFGGQQQAQVNPMALALQILGLGRQERQTAADLALRREALAAEERLRGEEATGRQATQLHQQTMERLAQQAAEREQKYREDALGFEKSKLGEARIKQELDMLGEFAKANPNLKLEEFQKMIAPYSETQRQVLASTLEETQKQKAKELETAVRTLYAKRAPREVFENLVKAQPEEVMARVPWQELAAGARPSGGVTQAEGPSAWAQLNSPQGLPIPYPDIAGTVKALLPTAPMITVDPELRAGGMGPLPGGYTAMPGRILGSMWGS
jgi:hypothetical protein